MTDTPPQRRSGPSRSAASHAQSFTAEHLKTRSWEFEPRASAIFRCPYVAEVTIGLAALCAMESFSISAA
ncbi:MAG: hypothetical protein WAN75_03860 [Xanthobacteraceae bacterium]|jgi:hypothetical protein